MITCFGRPIRIHRVSLEGPGPCGIRSAWDEGVTLEGAECQLLLVRLLFTRTVGTTQADLLLGPFEIHVNLCQVISARQNATKQQRWPTVVAAATNITGR